MTLPNGSAFYASVAEFCERYNIRAVGAGPSFISDDVPGQVQVDWADFDRLPVGALAKEYTAEHRPGTVTTHRNMHLDGLVVCTCRTVPA